jgi:hypothetical protein
MIAIILLIVFQICNCDAWSGIVLDGTSNTQLYIPGNPPIKTSNVNFGLSHLVGQEAVMLNGRAYFIGGYSPTNVTYTNTVTIFNPSTNTSTTGAPLNIARRTHGATVVNDMIIVCGGSNVSTDLSSCEQYNPSTQKWIMITSLPTLSLRFVMATLNNRAYAFGGSAACVITPPVYMFNGQNWESRSSIAGLPSWDHAGVAIDADRALICGGLAYKEGSCSDIADCFIYSASSDSWTQAAPMAQIRCRHSMVMFEGERSKNGLKNLYQQKLQIRYTYSGVIVATEQQLNYIHLQMEDKYYQQRSSVIIGWQRCRLVSRMLQTCVKNLIPEL